jgi:hypothetical protein
VPSPRLEERRASSPADPDEQSQVNVTEFSLDQTKAILVNAGFEPTLFAQRQLELLQLPQNLSLFLEGGADPSKPPTFRTATELFDSRSPRRM